MRRGRLPLLTRIPPVFLPGMVERRPSDGSEEQSPGISGQSALMPPIPDKSLLHDILGISHGPGPLTGTKQEAGTVLGEPNFPRWCCMGCLHGLV